MAAICGAASLVAAVRYEARTSVDGPAPANQSPPRPPKPLLSVSKPSWVVRTESNVRKEKRKKPEPSCVVCGGNGRVDCHDCRGRGRTNHPELPMLPKGEWPKWCRSCGGSGLGYCSRCLGTGEYRYIMGFHFMKREDDTQLNQKHPDRDKERSLPFSELLLNDGQLDEDHTR